MNAVIYPEPAPIAHAQTTSGARASTAHSAAIELEVTQDMVQVIIHFSSKFWLVVHDDKLHRPPGDDSTTRNVLSDGC